jgi:hypothetical protein
MAALTYAAVEKDKVRGVGAKHILTDLVSLICSATNTLKSWKC